MSLNKEIQEAVLTASPFLNLCSSSLEEENLRVIVNQCKFVRSIKLNSLYWLKYLVQLPHLETLKLDVIWEFSNEELASLAEFKQLRHLEIYGSVLSKECFKAFEQLTQLEELCLNDCENFSDDEIASLISLKNLKSLHLELADTTDKVGAVLAQMQQLTSLTLIRANETDAVLKNLKLLKNLQRLSLYGFPITDTSIKNISVHKNLTSLSLKDLDQNLSTASLKLITSLPNLTELSLRGFEYKMKGIEQIRNLKNLSKLHLEVSWEIENLNFLSENVHLKELQLERGWLKRFDFLSSLKELKLLKIPFQSINHRTILAIAQHKDLYHLNVSSNSIGDLDLKKIGQMENLSFLDLSGCSEITDEGIRFLTNLKNLAYLNLRECKKVTDHGLESLSQLEQLSELDLYHCDEITDKGLTALSNLKKLRQLDVRFCHVTSSGCESLMKDIPFLKINKINYRNKN